MKENHSKTRRSELYGDFCYVTHVERQAVSIALYSSHDIWCNLNDGRFIRKRGIETNPVIKSISDLYSSIKKVEAGGFIIAKRPHPEAALKFVKCPIPIKKMGRHRTSRLEKSVYRQ